MTEGLDRLLHEPTGWVIDKVVVVAKTQINELLLEKQLRGDAKNGKYRGGLSRHSGSDVKCCFVRCADGSKTSKSVYVP
jgi:hypothetical protein